MAEKKYVGEMLAEAFREAGVLAFVFAPLYELFEPYKPRRWAVFVSVMVVGVLFFCLGIVVERRRK